jgi:hypothetical protein
MPDPASDFGRAKPVAAAQAPGVLRIQFVEAKEPPAGRIIGKFTQPRQIYSIALDSGAGTSQLEILLVTERDARTGIAVDAWLATPEGADGRCSIKAVSDGGIIYWRTGRAVVEAAPEVAQELVSAVVEFSFLEGELYQLEQALLPHESNAPNDVTYAYEVRGAHREQWARLVQTMQSLAHLRLTYARLEPHLIKGRHSLPVHARRSVSRLIARADVPARLEALSDRLEACEDLYEGAVDRITDFRWYKKGYWLEMAIVLLLAAEVFLLLFDLYFWRH